MRTLTSNISSLYIWLFRGTPILVQLLLRFNIALVLPTLAIAAHRAPRRSEVAALSERACAVP